MYFTLLIICLQAGEEYEKEFQEKYGKEKVSYFRTDVTSHQNFHDAFEKCRELFGKVDILVNSAGIIGENNWETQLQINLFGAIRGTKLALKYMTKGGIVLNISSVHGLHVRPTMPTYSAGKSGIITFTRSAGHPIEYADHGIKIICLCPGAVDTPLGVSVWNFKKVNSEPSCDFIVSLSVNFNAY